MLKKQRTSNIFDTKWNQRSIKDSGALFKAALHCSKTPCTFLSNTNVYCWNFQIVQSLQTMKRCTKLSRGIQEKTRSWWHLTRHLNTYLRTNAALSNVTVSNSENWESDATMYLFKTFIVSWYFDIFFHLKEILKTSSFCNNWRQFEQQWKKFSG